MVRPSMRMEEETRSQFIRDLTGLMTDLVRAAATKKDLEIGARVYRIARNTGVDTSSWSKWIEILTGQNKHETNFVEALGEE